MRLMIIGVIAFGSAALAMIIADGRLPRSLGIDQLWGGDVKQTRFVNARWSPRQKSKELVIPVPQEKWRVMTGFPSYASLSFPLPKHTPIEAGQFILEFKIQLPKSGGGALRVVVNNEKRAELLFDANREKYRVIIALTDKELTASTIDIALSADGYGAGGECPDDRSRAAIIEISPRTRLELDLKEPLTHLSDIALFAGTPIRISVPSDDNQLARERSLALALALRQRGDEVVFDAPTKKGALTVRVDPRVKMPRYDERTNQIVLSGPLHIDEVFSSRSSKRWGSTQKILVDALDAQVYARQFRHEIKWRIDFDLKDMPDGKAPSEFNLELFRSITSENPSSILTLSLNGRLLYSGGLRGRNNPLKSAYKLPSSAIALRNTLEISLNTNEDRIGVCNPGRDAFAQLLKSSTLAELEKPVLTSETGLPYRLAQHDSLNINIPNALTKAELDEVLSFVQKILPSQTKLITSERNSPSSIPEAIVIPIARLREDYDTLVPSNTNDKKREFWIAAQGHEQEATYQLLTREVANTIFTSRSLGGATIISFPVQKPINENEE